MKNQHYELIQEYKEGRTQLKEMLKRYDLENVEDTEEIKVINSMINEMTFVIEWLETGRNPNEERGIHKSTKYSHVSLEAMGQVADNYGHLRKEREAFGMNDNQKRIVSEVLSSFTDVQRYCFLSHVCQFRTLQDIADELEITKSTVQSHIMRAWGKVEKIQKEYDIK